MRWDRLVAGFQKHVIPKLQREHGASFDSKSLSPQKPLKIDPKIQPN